MPIKLKHIFLLPLFLLPSFSHAINDSECAYMRDEIEDASVSLEEKKETFERMNEDVRSLSESLDYQEGRLNMLRSVLQSCASRQNSMGMSNTCVSETMEYDMVANEYRSSVDRHNRLIDDRDDVISSHDAMVVEINDQIDDFNRACKTE